MSCLNDERAGTISRPANVVRIAKPGTRAQPALLLLILLLLVWFPGCARNQAGGQSLATTGAAAADTLAEYYDGLIQDTLDVWDLEAFIAALRQASFTEDQQKKLQVQVTALGQRAAMARRLAAVYASLGQLSTYDASGEVQKAAKDLSQSIVKLTPISTAQGSPDPSDIFGAIAGDLAAWQQSREIEKNAARLGRATKRVAALFDAELPVYTSIPEERGNKAASVTEHLIRNGYVSPLPLVRDVPATIGLTVATTKPVDQATLDALIPVAGVRMHRAAFNSASAAGNISSSMDSLVDNHATLKAGDGVDLDRAAAAIARAQFYLDEIVKFRKAAKRQSTSSN